MRDLIIGVAMFGALLGVGCGVALAGSDTSDVSYHSKLTKAKPDLAQYQTPQSSPSPSTMPTTELPATNPPYALIGAVVVAVGIAVVAYFILR